MEARAKAAVPRVRGSNPPSVVILERIMSGGIEEDARTDKKEGREKVMRTVVVTKWKTVFITKWRHATASEKII